MSKLTRKLTGAMTGGALAATLAIAGCGSSTAAPKPASKPTIELTSSAVQNGKAIPARYTCDGKDLSLPLKWRGVPTGTSELTVFVLAIAEGSKLSPQWGVAHIPNTVTGMKAGKLPRGALVGTNEEGSEKYVVCPPKGFRTTYLVFVYAVPQSFALAKGYRVLDLLGSVTHTSSPFGQLIFTYTRH